MTHTLKEDAFYGLSNKSKRDRLILDLLENPNLLVSLDPRNLIPFESFLALSVADRICLNDITCLLLMFEGEDYYGQARELAEHNLDLAALTGEMNYATFPNLILDFFEEDEPFHSLYMVYTHMSNTLCTHHDSLLV